MTRVRARRAKTAVGGPPATFMVGFDLRCGPLPAIGDRPPVFATDADRRAAWDRHGEWMLAVDHRPGHRPEAWWNYTPGIPPRLRWRTRGDPGDDRRRFLERLAWLSSSGHLEPGERRRLERAAVELPTYLGELAREEWATVVEALTVSRPEPIDPTDRTPRQTARLECVVHHPVARRRRLAGDIE